MIDSVIVVPDDADDSYSPEGYVEPSDDDSQVNEAHAEVGL